MIPGARPRDAWIRFLALGRWSVPGPLFSGVHSQSGFLHLAASRPTTKHLMRTSGRILVVVQYLSSTLRSHGLYYTLLYSILYSRQYSTILYSTLYSTLPYTILYSTLLHYTLLYSTILYYTLLYSTILYSTLLYYTILYYTILYYTILYYTILYYTILYHTIFGRHTRAPCHISVLKTKGHASLGT